MKTELTFETNTVDNIEKSKNVEMLTAAYSEI